MERALAEHRHEVDARRRRHALEEVEVREAAARRVEVVVDRADLVEQRVRHEDAVALPLAVEPVAVADEVPDVEQPVAVDRPFDLLEEPVLVTLVVALRNGLVLLAGAHVPLLDADHGRGVARQAEHAEVQHPRRQDVGAVDHHGDGPPARDLEAAVEGVRGRGRRVVTEVEVLELGAEALDEVLAEALVRGRAVLDGDHLVVEVLDVVLVGARERVQRARGLAPHVVEDHQHRQGQVALRGPRGAWRVHGRLTLGLAPVGAAPVDALQPARYGALGAKCVYRLGALGRPVVVDDHEPARPHLVVEGMEDRGHLLRLLAIDPQQRDVLDRRRRQGLAGSALQKADPVVEQAKALEALAHRVQVRWEPRGAILVGRRSTAESIRDPQLPAEDPMAGEVRREEDRGSAPAGAAVDQVARHGPLPDRVQAPLQMVQPRAADLRQGQRVLHVAVGRCGRQLSGAARLLEAAQVRGQIAAGIAQAAAAEALCAHDARDQMLDPDLVLQIVLVQHGALDQIEVARRRARGLPRPPVVKVVEFHLLVDPDRFAELDQLVAAGAALEPVEHLP